MGLWTNLQSPQRYPAQRHGFTPSASVSNRIGSSAFRNRAVTILLTFVRNALEIEWFPVSASYVRRDACTEPFAGIREVVA